LKDRLQSIVSSPRLPLFVTVAAVLLVLPSLWSGFQLDDIFQRYFLLGNEKVGGGTMFPTDLFNFLDGDPASVALLRDAGVIPWWTYDHLRLSFWRPLSALTHWLDYALWPDQPVLMHLQNLFWFGLLVWIASLLYRRVSRSDGSPAGVLAAGMAALLFAVDDAHGLPAGWLANRNALVAGVFGFLALLALMKTREEKWKWGPLCGSAALAAGLLSGESALGACAYLAAYAFLVVEGGWREKARALSPYVLVAVSWLWYYHFRGYGSSGSGFYVDPFSDLPGFLEAVVFKAPILLLDQWALAPSSLSVFMGRDGKIALWVAGAVVMAIGGTVLLPLLRRDRIARFWALGMVLSLPVICTTVPHGRLLLFPGLGAMGILGPWLAGVWGGAGWVPESGSRRKVFRVISLLMVFVHLVASPILLTVNSLSSAVTEPFVQEPAERLDPGPGVEQRTVVLVNPPVFFFAEFLPTVRFLNGQSVPGRIRMLAPGDQDIRVTRTDENSLRITTARGWITSPFDDVFRGASHPFAAGDTVRMSGLEIKIGEITPDGRPREVLFRFHESLESPRLQWFRWENGAYVPFVLPEVGLGVGLPAANFIF